MGALDRVCWGYDILIFAFCWACLELLGDMSFMHRLENLFESDRVGVFRGGVFGGCPELLYIVVN